MNLTFTATAADPGSDDLTFIWDWGDGTPATATTYYNDGIGPDPYPSPGGTFPFTATDTQAHAVATIWTHVTLTVLDDDGGSVVLTLSPLVTSAEGHLGCFEVNYRLPPDQGEAQVREGNSRETRDLLPLDPSPPAGS